VIQRLFLFVCSGNTSRSPMAQAICNAEIAKRLKIPLESLHQFGVEALSAGLCAKSGMPMTSQAQDALREIGITGVIHTARQLDAQMVNRAEAVFCMTDEQRVAAITMFPDAASKIYRLHPEEDIDDPSGEGPATFLKYG
jgi:protein-tyrosine phosphatase